MKGCVKSRRCDCVVVNVDSMQVGAGFCLCQLEECTGKPTGSVEDRCVGFDAGLRSVGQHLRCHGVGGTIHAQCAAAAQPDTCFEDEIAGGGVVGEVHAVESLEEGGHPFVIAGCLDVVVQAGLREWGEFRRPGDVCEGFGEGCSVLALGNCGPVVTAAGFKQVEDNRGGLEVEFERGAKRVKSSGQANLLPLCSEVVGQQVSACQPDLHLVVVEAGAAGRGVGDGLGEVVVTGTPVGDGSGSLVGEGSNVFDG